MATKKKSNNKKNVVNKKVETKKVVNKKNNTAKVSVLSIILIIGIIFVSLILIGALYIIIFSPKFDKDKLYSKEASIIYYKDGSELTRLGIANRDLVNYDEMPEVLIDAFVATEDSRFFQHKGLDIKRFMKASVGQLLGQDSAGGASTITMQVIKKTYTDPDGKYTHGIAGIIRKFTDIYMAVFKVESSYTKEEILEFYANSMWFGNDGSLNYGSISGVEQASKYFFGKPVSDITLAEASILAGMYQNPSIYNPYKHPENTRKRQNIVLSLMVKHGYITEGQKKAVLEIPIESLLKNTEDTKTTANQAVIDYVRDSVEKNTGINPFVTPVEIYTTIDKDVQNVLTKLEHDEIYEFPNDKIQEAMVITSIKDGSIVGLSGGRNYHAKGLNRAVDIKRHPGSTAKPIFDYGPYIEYLNGSTYSPFLDEPTTYSNGTPIRNADRRYDGLMTMREALIHSRNIPALRAFKEVNKEKKNYIENFVHNLGINYGKDLLESMAIGGFDGVNPLQMSAAYAAFGREGYYIKPYIYTKVIRKDNGKTIEYKYEKKEAMQPETAYMITDMLISATQIGVGGVKVSNTDIASKGGTSTPGKAIIKKLGIPSNATMDAWNITYSPEYSIALWIGYDQLTSDYYLNSNIGGRVRKGVMKAVGSRVYSKNKHFKQPGNITSVAIEKETIPAQLPSTNTPDNFIIKGELFKKGTEPMESSPRFDKLATPKNGTYKLNNTAITLSWDPIETPEAIDNTILQEHFNKYYDTSASKYYEKRIAYNNDYIGTLGYNVYLKNADGSLNLLNRTTNSTYTVENLKVENPTFVITANYSIFKNNMSDALEIKVKQSIDENVEEIIKPTNPDEQTETTTPSKPDNPIIDLD